MKCTFITILMLCGTLFAIGQNTGGKSLYPSIPASPQAESFRRIGEYTVNNSSGIPDINIPLYEINHCGYKIPLALRYMAVPIKPGYNYDVYGFGWGLSLSSCISRSIESQPDEEKNFKLSSGDLDKRCDIYINSLNYSNWMSDKFNAVLPDGSSFDFFILNDQPGGVYYMTSSGKYVKIECHYTQSNINSFTVTDENGIKYQFDVPDTAFLKPGAPYTDRYVTWYLSRIDLPTSVTPILFSYGPTIRTKFVNGYSEPTVIISHTYPVDHLVQQEKVEVSLEQGEQNCYYKMRLLSGIHYGVTDIDFGYKKDVEESAYNYIERITVSDDQAAVKTFKFDFNIGAVRVFGTRADTLSSLRCLVMSGTNGNDSLVYTFTYTGIGSGLSGTDHWGNYNYYGTNHDVANFNFFVEFDTNKIISGSTSESVFQKLTKESTELCPYWKLKMQHNPSFDTRKSSPCSSHNVLSSITYPTGGRTEFLFENHSFITATAENGNYIFTNKKRNIIEGGGFRIRKITNYTADGKVADVKSYRYGCTYGELCSSGANFPGCGKGGAWKHVGYGEPVVDPNLLTYSNYAPSTTPLPDYQLMLLGLSPEGRNELFPNPYLLVRYDWYWECRFSPLNFRALLHGRTAVVYPEISVYHGDIGNDDDMPENTIGKTVYKYDIYSNDTVYFEPLRRYINVMTCQERPYKRNLLMQKMEYAYENNVFKPVSKETYDYSYFYSGIEGYLYNNTYAYGHYRTNDYIRVLFSKKYDYFGFSRPFSRYTTLYTDNGNLTMSESYSYNLRNQMTKKSEFLQKQTDTNYIYPDTSEAVSPVVRKMVERNIISPILSSRTSKISADVRDVSGYRVDYNEFTSGGVSLLLPEKTYRLAVDGAAPGFVEEEQVLAYSANGNPKETVDRNGMHTVFLWGYNDRYIIAEVRNATTAKVESAVQSVFGTSIDGLAALSSPSATSLAALRNHVSLKDAFTSTFTYRPLVGVTSQTSPSGISTYYNYDGLGRLMEIFRYDNNTPSAANKLILKQYSYNTVNH